MYFTKDAADLLGLNVNKLKERGKRETYNSEQTGVYRKIDPNVLERILKEESLTPETKAKKTG